MKRIMFKLKGRDRKLMEDFFIKECYQADELACALSKLNGTWPGWEWMKKVKIVKFFINK